MRSSRKAIVLTLLLALVLLLAMSIPALATTAVPELQRSSSGVTGDWVDGTYKLGDQDTQFRALEAKMGVQSFIHKLNGGPPPVLKVGDEFTQQVSDFVTGNYPETFVVQSIGVHSIICVTKAAYQSFDGTYYHFANPVGDGSSMWMRTEDLLTQFQLQYLKKTFDTTIWDTESKIWGTPLSRGDQGNKVWILVYNIRCEAYHDPTVKTYVAGYFSSWEDSMAGANRNEIHIDTYDWADRTRAGTARPYLYEGVFAHEYQHLLHADIDPNEESWVDEGMADFAAFRCGFLKDVSHVREYMKYWATTSLTTFRSYLEDYGAAYLFQLYLWENYGGDAFTKAVLHDQNNGIQGIQDQLSIFKPGTTFNQVFNDWTLANYFDPTAIGPSKYQYKDINLGTDTQGYTIPYVLTNPIDPGYGISQSYYYYANFFADYNGMPGYPYGPYLQLPFAAYGSLFYWEGLDGWGSWPALPYTAHYYLFNQSPSIKVTLDGDDQAGVTPHGGSNQMTSGYGGWAWTSMYKAVTVPVGDTTANMDFWMWWDTEPDYDYGYVEVTDGSGWWTLPITDYDTGDPLTVTTLPQSTEANPNTDLGRNPNDYFTAGRWNALNGASDGYTHGKVDLSQFAGKNITIYFTLWQDPFTDGKGLYVDDVTVHTNGSSDYADFESDADGWLTPAANNTWAWTRGSGMADNNFQGTLVQISPLYPTSWRTVAKGPLNNIKVTNTAMNATSQSGTVALKVMDNSPSTWLYIVSNRAPHILPSDYYIEATAK